jgi:calcium/calmodulin-dependent protein kinase I
MWSQEKTKETNQYQETNQSTQDFTSRIAVVTADSSSPSITSFSLPATPVSAGSGYSSSITNNRLMGGSRSLPKKLSLSAYRKPETAVRLTSAPRHKHLEDDYELDGGVIGHGASSTVRLGTHRSTGDKVAIKSVAKHDVLRRRYHNQYRPAARPSLEELEILLSLKHSHPSIVNLLDVYETESEVHLVLEYCSGGELFDLIQDSKLQCRKRRRSNSSSGFSEGQVARILSQLLSALAHLHKRGIVHRDVKPENILISNNTAHSHSEDIPVKLSDFGLARVLHSSCSSSGYCDSSPSLTPLTPPTANRSRAYSRVGSDFYTAPEVGTGAGYDTAVDIYSLGVTMYILLSGHPPSHKAFSTHTNDESVLDTYSSASDYTEDEDDDHPHHSGPKAVGVEFPPSHWSHVSSCAKNLLKKMLHPDPMKRITASQALQHEFILCNLCFHSLTYSSETTPTLPFVSTFDPRLNYHYLATRLFPAKKNKKRRRSSSFISTKDLCTFPTMPCPQNIITPASQPATTT